MNTLRKKLEESTTHDNAEQRVTLQVMDLELIKYKGVQEGDIEVGDDIDLAIDNCIRGFLWLYDKGLTLETSVADKLTEEADQTYYKQFGEAFSIFNDFMRTHMHLKD
ncbi:hypothetical protein PP175_26260 (plasmid) [Aneurinibacillus sp. Ricciae_BoGa-3]|uniref:hypothetical protein n=1 Tax=Aneurinibacillus sp. Ricciae_BoGa-3 TaxID=3022697 RepID=UPI002340DCA2|nr:hypothetical protein [Aneurinibacillus sp. Ricciae_BoGa-3]WCK57572.1 hypothetical protein PP175_26260 [Aneurinibacillus sp. Ricciae_BoGa-3]